MRFSLYTVLFGALLASAASTKSSLTSKNNRDGSSVDLCVDLKINVAAALNKKLHLRLLEIRGKVEECLCVSTVSSFIQHNHEASVAVRASSKKAVTNALISIIESHRPELCHYPAHSVPVCKARDPCSFKCKSPFVKATHGKKCVLPPSARSREKREQEHIMHNAPKCQRGQRLCPLWNTPSVLECVNVQTDLFSCGGCTHGGGLKFGSEAMMKEGQDCSAIEGVSDVSCIEGTCHVRKCTRGFQVSRNGTSCSEM